MQKRMKNVMAVATVALVAGGAGTARAELIISEVVDGNLTGGVPKWVEITNTGAAAIDLSAYSFGNFSNGGASLGGGAATVLSGSLAAGDSYVIEYDTAEDSIFSDIYGFAADFYMGGRFTNGDDAYGLFLGAATGDGSDATLVDVYGVIGVDGSGEVWEYTDGFAYRLATVVAGTAAFDAAEWVFGGPDSLDLDDDTLALQSLTTPGAHLVPEPASLALLGIGGLLAARRRAA